MGKFHRFVAPTYTGAPTLPVAPSTVSFEGTLYNLFNVTSGGTGAGGSAFADDAKGSGPNAGTLMVAFGEDATSSNANRGLKALAENTDVIDDILHRDIAMPVRTSVVTPVAPVPSIALPAATFVGNSGAYPLDMLFELVDAQDREIINPATGAKITVASIAGAAIGDGFSAGVVTLTLTEAIPTGQPYHLYYASRGDIATLPVDALTFIRVRGALEIAAEVEKVFSKIQAPSVIGQAWDATPFTTLYDLAYGGLGERYKRATVRDGANPAYHPAALTLDTQGAGGWYIRPLTGPGITAYSQAVVSNGTGSLGLGEHVLGANWGVVLQDTITATGVNPARRGAASSGFVFFGGLRRGPNDGTPSTPGLFSYYAGSRKSTSSIITGRTILGAGTTVTLNTSVMTLSGSNQFYKNEGGPNRASFALGIDIIRLSVAGVVHTVTVSSFSSATVGSICYLDGAIPNFAAGTPATILEVIQTTMFASDGGNNYWDFTQNGGIPGGADFKGFVFCSPPNDQLASPYTNEYARFFASDDTPLTIQNALSWGGYSQTFFKYFAHSYLTGDGGAYINGVLSSNGGASFFGGVTMDTLGVTGNITSGGTATFNAHQAIFNAGFTVNGGSVMGVTGSWRQLGGQKWYGQSTNSLAPTMDCDASSPFISWLLDAATPSGAGSNVVTMVLNNLTAGIFTSGRVFVAIRRTSGSLVNQVSFTCTGCTSVLDSSDALLSPITSGGTYWWDVYEGAIINGTVFWKVNRYRT